MQNRRKKIALPQKDRTLTWEADEGWLRSSKHTHEQNLIWQWRRNKWARIDWCEYVVKNQSHDLPWSMLQNDSVD